MNDILNLFGWVGNFLLPIFVFLTMFNVGLTQTLNDFFKYLPEWKFYLRMLLVNFILAPAVMWLLLQVFSLSKPLEIGLIIFSMAAGAPFVIKLTQFSDNDIALGATLLVILVFATSAFVPIALPLVLPTVSIDAGQIFTTLVRQLIFPHIFRAYSSTIFQKFCKKYPALGW